MDESMIQFQKTKYAIYDILQKKHKKDDHHDSDNMRNQSTELMGKKQYGIDINRDDNNNNN